MTKRNDVDMINNSFDWPCFPYLPMKRYTKDGSWPECGLIWSGAPLRVVNANMFHLPPTAEDFMALPHKEYADAAAMVADGWMVD